MKILHLSTAKTLRGGELQTEYLAAHDAARSLLCLDQKLLLKHPDHFRKNAVISLNMSFLFGLPAIAQLAKISKKLHIKTIHAHTSRAHNFALVLKLLVPKLRIMATKRVLMRKNGFFSSLKYSPSLNERIFAVSEAVKNSLPEKIRDHSTVVYSASSSEPAADEHRAAAKIKISQKYALPHECCIITMAAHFSKEKRWADLIQSLAFLKTTQPWIVFAAGSGPTLKAMQNLARKIGVEKKIIFLGHVNEIRELFLASDVALLLSSWEALGTTLLEAGLAGCTLIGTDVGGIPEAVVPGKSGFLVPPGDLFQLAHILDHLIDQPTLRYDLSQSARSFISHKFSLTKLLDAYQRAYDLKGPCDV